MYKRFGMLTLILVILTILSITPISSLATPTGKRPDYYILWRSMYRDHNATLEFLTKYIDRSSPSHDPLMERYFWQHVVADEWFNGYYAWIVFRELVPRDSDFYIVFFNNIISGGYKRYVLGDSSIDPIVDREGFAKLFRILFTKLVAMDYPDGYYYREVAELARHNIWGYAEITRAAETIYPWLNLEHAPISNTYPGGARGAEPVPATSPGEPGAPSPLSNGGGMLRLNITDPSGRPLNGIVEVYPRGCSGGYGGGNIPWDRNYTQRIVVSINTQYSRTGFPIPLRIDFAELGAQAHVDPSDMRIYQYYPDTGSLVETRYSAVEVDYNVFWITVEANTTSGSQSVIVIYYHGGGSYSPGTVYGDYPVFFPTPLSGGQLEQVNLQFDKEVPSGSNYGSNYYVLLMAPRGTVFPDSDTGTGEGRFLGDNDYYASSIPFPFAFSTLYIGSNGQVSPVNNYYVIANPYDSRSNLASLPLLAVHWDDLKDYTGYTVYETTGVLHGLQYKTWYWETGYPSGYDGQARFRLYLLQDGSFAIHTYSFVAGASGGFTIGISDSQGRWMSPISTTDNYNPLLPSPGDLTGYELIFVKVDTISYTVDKEQRGVCNRDGVYTGLLANGSFTANLTPGVYDVVVKGGVYGYISSIEVDGATDVSLIAYPVAIHLLDSANLSMAYAAVDLYWGVAGTPLTLLERTHTNASGYIEAYFLEGEYIAQPIIYLSDNPELVFTVSPSAAYPATYTFNVYAVTLNITISTPVPVSGGEYVVAVSDYYTGSMIAETRIAPEKGWETIYVAPGTYTVALLGYRYSINGYTAYIAINETAKIRADPGDSPAAPFSLAAATITVNNTVAGYMFFNTYLLSGPPGLDTPRYMGVAASNTTIPLSPGAYVFTPMLNIEWSGGCAPAQLEAEVTGATVLNYTPAIPLASLTIALVTDNTSIPAAYTALIHGSTVCGELYETSIPVNTPILLPPGNYTVAVPGIAYASPQGAIGLGEGSETLYEINVSLINLRITDPSGRPVEDAVVRLINNANGITVEARLGSGGEATLYLAPGNYTVELAAYRSRYQWRNIEVEPGTYRLNLSLGDAEEVDEEIRLGEIRFVLNGYLGGGYLAIDEIKLFRINASHTYLYASIEMNNTHGEPRIEAPPGTYRAEIYAASTLITVIDDIDVGGPVTVTVPINISYIRIQVSSNGNPVAGAPVFIESTSHGLLGVWVTNTYGYVTVAVPSGDYIVYAYTAGGEDVDYTTVSATTPSATYNVGLEIEAGTLIIHVYYNDTGLPGVAVRIGDHVVETGMDGYARIALYPGTYSVTLPYNSSNTYTVTVNQGETTSLEIELHRLIVDLPINEPYDAYADIDVVVDADTGPAVITRRVGVNSRAVFYLDNGTYTVAIHTATGTHQESVAVDGDTVYTAPLSLIAARINTAYPVHGFYLVVVDEDEGETSYIYVQGTTRPWSWRTVALLVEPGTYSVRLAGYHYGDDAYTGGPGGLTGYGDSAGTLSLGPGDALLAEFNLSGIAVLNTEYCGPVKIYVYDSGSRHYYAEINESTRYIGLSRGYYLIELPNGNTIGPLYLDGVHELVFQCSRLAVELKGPSGEPVQGARVIIVNANGTRVAEGYTGPDGVYGAALLNGTYTIVLPGANTLYDPYSLSLTNYTMLGDGFSAELYVSGNTTYTITLSRVTVSVSTGTIPVDDVMVVMYSGDRPVAARLTSGGSTVFYAVPGNYTFYIRGVDYAWGVNTYLGLGYEEYAAGRGDYVGSLQLGYGEEASLSYTSMAILEINARLAGDGPVEHTYTASYPPRETVFASGTGPATIAVTPGEYLVEYGVPGCAATAERLVNVTGPGTYSAELVLRSYNVLVNVPHAPEAPTSILLRIYTGYASPSNPGSLYAEIAVAANQTCTLYLPAEHNYTFVVPGPYSDGTGMREGYGRGAAATPAENQSLVVFNVSVLLLRIVTGDGYYLGGINATIALPGYTGVSETTNASGYAVYTVTPGEYQLYIPMLHSLPVATITVTGLLETRVYTVAVLRVAASIPADNYTVANPSDTIRLYDSMGRLLDTKTLYVGGETVFYVAQGMNYTVEAGEAWGLIEPVDIRASSLTNSYVFNLSLIISSIRYINGSAASGWYERTIYDREGYAVAVLQNPVEAAAVSTGEYSIVYDSTVYGGPDNDTATVAETGSLVNIDYVLGEIHVTVLYSGSEEPVEGALVRILRDGALLQEAATDQNGSAVFHLYASTYTVTVIYSEGSAELSQQVILARGEQEAVVFHIVTADLSVERVEITPSDPGDGDLLYIYATVKNNGPGSITHDFTVRLYANNTLADQATIHGLVAGKNTTIVLTATARAPLLNITVVVDEEHSVVDENRSNNRYTLLVYAQPADLAVENVSFTPPPADKDKGLVNVTIANNGPGNIHRPVLVYVYINNQLYMRTVNGLPAGSRATLTVSATMRSGPVEIRVEVDPRNEINEVNETNNNYTVTGNIPYVSLSVEASLPDMTSVYEGDVVEIRYRVINSGYPTRDTVHVEIYVDGKLVYTDTIDGVGGNTFVEKKYYHVVKGGTHNITISINRDHRVPEDSYGDNNATLTYTVPPADLLWETVTWTPSPASYGEPVTIYFTIRNNGSTTKNTFYVKAYVDGEYYNITTIHGGLGANATYSGEITLTGIGYGEHVLRLVIDEEDRVSESREDNNVYQDNITVLATDIEITSVSLNNTSPVAGEPVDVTVTIRNNGPGDTARGFYTAVFINGEYVGQTYYSGTLGAGEAVEIHIVFNARPGVNNITVIADDHYERYIYGYPVYGHHHELGDPDRGNNIYNTSLYAPAPDLEIAASVSPPETAWDKPSATVTVSNNGATAVEAEIKVEISVPSTGYRERISLGNMSLGPGESATRTIPQEDLPSLPPGTHLFIFTVDPVDEIAELNESNNAYRASITIPKPELYVSYAEVSPSNSVLSPGDTVNVTLTIRNNGTGFNHSFTIKIIDDVGNELYAATLPGLPEGGEYTVKTSIEATPPGGPHYYVGVDVYDEIPETREDNNIYTLTLPPVRSLLLLTYTLRYWVNGSDTAYLKIMNNGGANTTITSIHVNVSWLTISYSETSLAPGDTASMPATIDFAAVEPGYYGVAATVETQDYTYVFNITVAVLEPAQSMPYFSVAPQHVEAGAGERGYIVVDAQWDSSYNLTLRLGGNASAFFQDTVLVLRGGYVHGYRIPYSIGGVDGRYVLRVSATIPETGVNETHIVVFDVSLEPRLRVFSPGNNTAVPSTTIVVAFATNVPTNYTVTVLDTNTSETITLYGTEMDTEHTLYLGGLEYGHVYSITITVSSIYASYTSKPYYVRLRQDMVGFARRRYEFTLRRDYNQIISIQVNNYDPSFSHRVIAYIENPYSDIIADFTGPGSRDEAAEIGPGDSMYLALAVHLADAENTSYTLYAHLVNLDTGYTDTAEITIHVVEPTINIEIEHMWTDNYTLVQLYVIHNYGDTITDLSLALGGNIIQYTYLYPAGSHVYLPPQSSLYVYVTPSIPAMPEEAWSGGETGVTTGSLILSVGGEEVAEEPVDMTPPENTRPYAVNMPRSQLTGKAVDWYCTNRPVVDVVIPISHDPPGGRYRVYLMMDFQPHSDVRPHNGRIYLNGHLVYSWTNTTPTGTLVIQVPYEYLGLDPGGHVSYARVHIETEHMNGGHYVVATNFRILVYVDKPTPFYVFAHSYDEALRLFAKPKPLLGILNKVVVNAKAPKYFNPTKLPVGVRGLCDEAAKTGTVRAMSFTVLSSYIDIGAASYENGRIPLSVECSPDGTIVFSAKEYEKLSIVVLGEINHERTESYVYVYDEKTGRYVLDKIVIDEKTSYEETLGLGKAWKALKSLKKLGGEVLDKLLGRTTREAVREAGEDIASSIGNYLVGEAADAVKGKLEGVPYSIDYSLDLYVSVTQETRTVIRPGPGNIEIVTQELDGDISIDAGVKGSASVSAVTVTGGYMESKIEARMGTQGVSIHYEMSAGLKPVIAGAAAYTTYSVDYSKSWGELFNTHTGIQFINTTQGEPPINPELVVGLAMELIEVNNILLNLALSQERNYTPIDIAPLDQPVEGNITDPSAWTLIGYGSVDEYMAVLEENIYNRSIYRLRIYRINEDGAAAPAAERIIVSGEALREPGITWRGGKLLVLYLASDIDNLTSTGVRRALLNTSVYTLVYDPESSTITGPVRLGGAKPIDYRIVVVNDTPLMFYIGYESGHYYIAYMNLSMDTPSPIVLGYTVNETPIVAMEAYARGGDASLVYATAFYSGDILRHVYTIHYVPAVLNGNGSVINIASSTAIEYIGAAARGDEVYIVVGDGYGVVYAATPEQLSRKELVALPVAGHVADTYLAADNTLILALHTMTREGYRLVLARIRISGGDAELVQRTPVVLGENLAVLGAGLVAVDGALKGIACIVTSRGSNLTHQYAEALVYKRVLAAPMVNIRVTTNISSYSFAGIRITLNNTLTVLGGGGPVNATLHVLLDGDEVMARNISLMPGEESSIELAVPLGGEISYVVSAYLEPMDSGTILFSGDAVALYPRGMAVLSAPVNGTVYNASSIPLALSLLSRGREVNGYVFLVLGSGGDGAIYYVSGFRTADTYASTINASRVTSRDTYAYLVVSTYNPVEGDGDAVYAEIGVDAEPPEITVSSPAENNTVVAGVLSINATISDLFLEPETVRVYINDTPVEPEATWINDTAVGITLSINTSMYRDGEPLAITLRARDKSGKTSTETLVYTPYNSGPAIQVLGPGNNTIVGARAEVSLRITGIGLDKLEVYVNDTLAETMNATSSMSINVSLPSTGWWIIKLIVYDEYGHTAAEKIRVYSDQDPPVLAAEVQEYASTALRVRVDASDISPFNIYYRIDLGEEKPLGLGENTIDVSDIDEGEHVLEITATDIHGNNVTRTFHFIVDRTPPTVTGVSIGNNTYTRGVIHIEYSASDQHIAGSEIYLNTTLVAANASSIDIDTRLYPDGVYVLRIIVYDSAGNNATVERTIIIDNTPPLAEILGVENNTVINTSRITITIRYYDANFEKAILYVDNQKYLLIQQYERNITLSLSNGTHVITLTVYDKAGNTNNYTIIITVNTGPGEQPPETGGEEVLPAPEPAAAPILLATLLLLAASRIHRKKRHHE